MKQTLKDIKVEYDKPISIIYDKISEIKISNNLVMHSKTKHTLIKYQFIRENASKQSVKLEYTTIKEQVVYIFTKENNHGINAQSMHQTDLAQQLLFHQETSKSHIK
jgi:hypothetical protein